MPNSITIPSVRKPGETVILGKHTDIGGRNWVAEMDKMVGKPVKLISMFGQSDSSGSPLWMVEGSTYSWREINMTSPVIGGTISQSSQVVNDFTCPTCKNNRCSKTEKTCWKCGNKLHP